MQQPKNSTLWLLVPLIAVGQITQTIYIPATIKIAQEMQVSSGLVQEIMAAYLFSFGFSQFIYGPISDRVGRRPPVLFGLLIFLIGTATALRANTFSTLVVAGFLQGSGTGVSGVMLRTIPRDLFTGDKLRKANSAISMGIIGSPLLGPLLGGFLTGRYGWRACYLFLLLLGVVVWLMMLLAFPETHPNSQTPLQLTSAYRSILSSSRFILYSVILTSACAGIAVFESCAAVLFGGVMGLPPGTVSILFILPLLPYMLGSWFAGSAFSEGSMMWAAALLYPIAGLMMWSTSWFGIISVWTILIPASLAFFAAGVLFPLATTMAMRPFGAISGSAGALVGGLQNLGAGVAIWISSSLPQHSQFSLGMLTTVTGIAALYCWGRVTRSKGYQV